MPIETLYYRTKKKQFIDEENKTFEKNRAKAFKLNNNKLWRYQRIEIFILSFV